VRGGYWLGWSVGWGGLEVCRAGAGKISQIPAGREQTKNFNPRRTLVTMVPMYDIYKIPPIYNILTIFAHESQYAIVLDIAFGNLSCWSISIVMLILCSVSCGVQPSMTLIKA